MTQSQTSLTTITETGFSQARIGLICDFVEENWPSMDLVAGMVYEHLSREHASSLEIARICPPLRQRFGQLPGIGKAPVFYNADRLLNRFVDYSRCLKLQIGEFDLFHLIDHSYSQLVHDLPAGKAVVTCHDLDTFRCVLEPERQPRPRWFRAMTNRILSGFRKAAHVIAVSSATRDEILRLGLHPAGRVTVIPNGVAPSCSPVPDPAADAELRRLLPIDSQEGVWMLNVGSSMPRKRLDLLLRIFAQVRKRVADVRLLRVGASFTPEQRQLARQLGIESSIVELNSLNREVLASAYRRSAVLVHTAEAEGFGLPVIEAMACGCSVIASDLPVLREVGGTAAGYCAVGDIEGWDAAVRACLERGKRESDREKALANAARFSWSDNAARTAQIYEQLLGKGL